MASNAEVFPSYVETRWLAQTKLQPPPSREDTIHRSLTSKLANMARTHVLTLLSAPAGYGKTTLLADLVSTNFSGNVAWLSLDADDNDPVRFIAALIASLQRVDVRYGATLRTLLGSLPNPAAEMRRLGDVLSNVILDIGSEIWLVLDDLHVIDEPSIYALLEHLLERAPPSLHLIASSRYDPPLSLARLRVRGQMAELRLQDLRFTSKESAEYLNETLGLGITAADLTALEHRTEGWPASLRLLAGSLARIEASEDRSRFIHFVAQTERTVFDFLAEEVLYVQQPDVVDFLLRTSILEELTPTLCQAVTGREDSLTILQNLLRHNLFLLEAPMPPGKRDERVEPTFRYHALFASFLHERLTQKMPGLVAELHHRAAQAYMKIDSTRAIGHYLTSEQWNQAANVIESVGDEMLQLGLLESVRTWIHALPPALVSARPLLSYLLGVSSRQRGDLDAARTWLDRAMKAFEEADNQEGQGKVLLELANIAGGEHDYARQMPLVQRALEFPLPPRGRVQLLIIAAWRALYQGEFERIEDVLAPAIQAAMESDDPGAYAVLALQLRSSFALLPDGIHRLEGYCQTILSRFGDAVGPMQAGAHSLLSYLALLRGQFDRAEQEAQTALSLTTQLGGYPYVDNEIDLALSHVWLARGDHRAMSQYWEGRWSRLENTPASKPWMLAMAYPMWMSQWLHGQHEDALQTAATMHSLATPDDLPEVVIAYALMRAHVEIGERRYAAGERILHEAEAVQLRFPHTTTYADPRVHLAYLYHQWDRPEDALDALAAALADSERHRAPGIVLKEGLPLESLLQRVVDRGHHAATAPQMLALLKATMMDASARPLPIPDSGEVLSPREVEVLRLVADGASNRVIAAELVITERTVKAHITSILGKLGVSSRTQAAARARELRML